MVSRATSHNPASDAPAAAPPLRLVFWETTTACNLACVHCRRLDVSRQLSADDLDRQQARDFVASIAELGRPILVFSGGEPLMRPDLLDLARYARDLGLPTALATNGTIMTPTLASELVDAGIRRVSMSLDGPDPATHDTFRGITGAFESTVRGFNTLRDAGMSMQINTSVSRHNFHLLDNMYQLALDLSADALHIFMLVPVGCGMSLSESVLLKPDEYEQALKWIYERSLEEKLHLKATCAPHYFRLMRQRAREAGQAMPAAAHPHRSMASGHPGGHPGGHPSGHPGASAGEQGDRSAMTAMTKGCLAGQAVCFVSHTGAVFPCGYLPVSSGNVKQTPLPTIWRDSPVFASLRDDTQLEGKCGLCEYKKVCMGCRARAYAHTGNYLAEEPNCQYVPVRVQRQCV